MDAPRPLVRAAGRALHVDGRKPHDPRWRAALLEQLGLDPSLVDRAIADPTTGDEVLAEHRRVVDAGGFGVPTLFFADGQACSGRCSSTRRPGRRRPAVGGGARLDRVPPLYELQRPKTPTTSSASSRRSAPTSRPGTGSASTGVRWSTSGRRAPADRRGDVVTDLLQDTPGADELGTELRTWLEDNWDPDLTVAAWWERLGTAGWAAPTLPTDAFGRGVARSVGVRIAREIEEFGALGAPGGLGNPAGRATIADHGTPEQVGTLVRDIVTGRRAWCQLFSEPGAGSDLAGLTTRAEEDGDQWVVNGQKVWTSLAADADLGMLIARTAPDLPKHRGITYFALDMHQPGVEVRPLREMTGHALFNETFLTDARVDGSSVIGGLDNGWAVTNTTLSYERSGLGSGRQLAGGHPGSLAGNLTRRVGDCVRAPAVGGPAGEPVRRSGMHDLLVGLARHNGASADPLVRQDLVRLYVLDQLGRMNGERLKAARAAGVNVPGMANIAKRSMSAIMRLVRDVGLRVVGAQGMLHAYDPADQAALTAANGQPGAVGGHDVGPVSQAPSIYGGTDQIQRNILGERVLGLPASPYPAGTRRSRNCRGTPDGRRRPAGADRQVTIR